MLVVDGDGAARKGGGDPFVQVLRPQRGNNMELDGDVPMFEYQRIEVVVTS